MAKEKKSEAEAQTIEQADQMEPAAGIEIEPASQIGGKVDGRPLVSFNALVRGVDVEVRNSLTGAIIAGDDVRLERGGARSIYAGGNLELRQGGAGVIVAGGDASITQGGAQAILSGGSVTMENGGSGFAIARRIRIRNGLTIFALTPRLEVEEGGKVVFGRSASMAIVGGLIGLAALLVALLRGRPGKRG